MSHWIRWAAIAFGAIAVVWYFVTGDSPNGTAPSSTGGPDVSANSRDERPEIPAMSVQVVAQDDWRSAVDPVLLQLFDPPDFELRVAEYSDTTGTWRTASALLTPRAEAGDPEAQYLLYRAAHRCFHGPHTLDELNAALARVGAADGAETLRVPPSGTPGHAERLRATYEFCADSSPDETAQAIDWVVAAADAGNIRAQLAYASETNFPGDELIERPYDEREAAILKERRDRAVSYLERAKAAGSVDAMIQLFGRQFADAATDPSSDVSRELRKAALANLYAEGWFRLRDRPPGDGYPGNSLRNLQKLGAQMPAHEYQEAVEAGRAILATKGCCLKFRDLK